MHLKVETYIQKHQLLIPDKPVIVGVSGGTDSVVLLHILKSLGYDCVIAHCNFHLRMEESDRDELFVRNLALEYKLPYYIIDFDTSKHASEHKISIEMAARDLRYAWFNELLIKLNAQAIAVAHHADDSIETLLMNLVRGTGFKGLTGIQPRNQYIVRPLLCLTRLEIETYLIRNDLEHIEDSTNASMEYQRNKFRNEILPLLEEINPSVRQTLYDSLNRFEGSMQIYQQAIDRIRNEVVTFELGILKLNIELIKNQVHIPTIMFELLHPYGFNSSVIEQITEQLNAESGKIFYSDTHQLLKDRKYLIVSKIDENADTEFEIQESETSITFPFKMKISKMNVTSAFKVSKDKNRVHIDASKLTFPLLLRRWHEGDTFYPFGMTKQKKVSNYFIDNKISIFEKKQSWLLTSGNDIVWIVGQRTDNRFRITDKTTEVLEFTIENL
ncbi:MAG: tRNA lysidine(34) synthetase TilS [Paludibacter sp.]|nr:tRNA lysidine(34) synthetase TilS [Paludibacter sp.]